MEYFLSRSRLRAATFALLLIFMLSCFGFTAAGTEEYDALDPNGNITIKWDVTKWTLDGYVAVVTIFNFQQHRHIPAPNWTLGWTWARYEVIWSMMGGRTTEQGNCSRYIGNIPYCCKKDPAVVDLLPGNPYNQQVANCCKGGAISSSGQDLTTSSSSFQISVGAAGTTRKTVKVPRNFTLKAPSPEYACTCGPAKIVKPTKFASQDGRVTQAEMTWNVTCSYSSSSMNSRFAPFDAPPSMNPALKPTNSLPPENSTFPVSFAVIGGVIGILAVIAMLGFLIFLRHRKVRKLTTVKPLALAVTLPTTLRPKISGSHVSLLSDLCRHFPLEELKMATANFDNSFVIGRGGFGNVYNGFIDDGTTAVAVKRLHSSSNQGALEFLTEIELLSKLRHLHLVPLIGFCDEKGEMILVYDYMQHGTLRDYLYSSNNPPLMWKHRLQICLGAAKGLDYLHTSTKHAIIHRDIKSTNILLDENWVAKVSDFGLSKVGPSDAANTRITTAMKGSFGYLDPEYYKRHQLTDKSDVYSFGVVLLEVLCGRPAILPCSQSQEPDEQVNLAEWANYCYEKGTIDQIVDSNLDKDQIAPECLNKFVETAIICLRGNRIERPAMSNVVRSLDLAMQLQEAAEGGNGAAGGGNFRSATSAFELTGEAYASKNSGLQYVEAFSELVNPAGR